MNENYDAFDRWLAACVDAIRTSPEPILDVDLRTGKAARSDAFFSKRHGSHEAPFVEANQLGSHNTSVCLPAEAVRILETFSCEQVLFKKGTAWQFLHPGALDLYTGRGGVARALLRGGCPWVVTFEFTRSACEDVLNKLNAKKILRLIVLRAVEVCGSALVCRSFSAAITPPVRSSRYPRGLPSMSAAMRVKVKEGNAMADFNAEVHFACEAVVPPVLYWTENPDAGFLWHRKGYSKFRDPASRDTTCGLTIAFGTPWRKRTRVALNIPKLRGLRHLCTCEKPHVQLRGQHPTLKRPWTSVAEP